MRGRTDKVAKRSFKLLATLPSGADKAHPFRERYLYVDKGCRMPSWKEILSEVTKGRLLNPIGSLSRFLAAHLLHLPHLLPIWHTVKLVTGLSAFAKKPLIHVISAHSSSLRYPRLFILILGLS